MLNFITLLLLTGMTLAEFKVMLKTISRKYEVDNIHLKIKTVSIYEVDTIQELIEIKRFGNNYYLNDGSSIVINRGQERLEVNHASSTMTYDKYSGDTTQVSFVSIASMVDSMIIDSFGVYNTANLQRFVFSDRGVVKYELVYDPIKRDVVNYRILQFDSPKKKKCQAEVLITYQYQKWYNKFTNRDFPINTYVNIQGDKVTVTEKYKEYKLIEN